MTKKQDKSVANDNQSNTLQALEDAMGKDLSRIDALRQKREQLQSVKLDTALANQTKNKEVALVILWENIERIQAKINKTDAIIDRLYSDLDSLEEFYARGSDEYNSYRERILMQLEIQQKLLKENYNLLIKMMGQAGYKESITETSKGATFNILNQSGGEEPSKRIGNPYPEEAHKRHKEEEPQVIEASSSDEKSFVAKIFD